MTPGDKVKGGIAAPGPTGGDGSASRPGILHGFFKNAVADLTSRAYHGIVRRTAPAPRSEPECPKIIDKISGSVLWKTLKCYKTVNWRLIFADGTDIIKITNDTGKADANL